MNVYDAMENLCKALKESHEYEVMQVAKKKLAEDKSAEGLVKEFLEKKQEIELIQYQGKEPEKGQLEKIQKLYEVLNLNPVASEYIQGYIRFQMMIGDLSKKLGDTIKEALE